MSTKHTYDLFVIGAGSGGVRAARVAAGHGAKVAIAEEYRIGGTCVIRGCVPKKLLVYGAHFAEDLEDARRFGWHLQGAKFDWPTLRDNVLAEVTRVNRGDQILRGYDYQIRDRLLQISIMKGIQFLFNAPIEKVLKAGDALTVHMGDGTALECEAVMFATGRVPNTDGLGLASAGVELDASGAVRVNDESRSTCPSIYAVGDVTNRVQLTPVAIREAQAFADTVFANKPTRVDYSCIPSAVFSHPPLAGVGMTEAE